jgi:hypothetical protein
LGVKTIKLKNNKNIEREKKISKKKYKENFLFPPQKNSLNHHHHHHHLHQHNHFTKISEEKRRENTHTQLNI